jgi:hypothetical protein
METIFMTAKLSRKERTYGLLIQIPMKFKEELERYFEERKSYGSYAEMYRHLIKVGFDKMQESRSKEETHG